MGAAARHGVVFALHEMSAKPEIRSRTREIAWL
jgi:hypothetical protein